MTTPILQYIRKHRTFVSDYPRDLGVKLLLQNLLKQESVCFDTETTGLDALHAELGISFSFEKERILCSFQKIKGSSNFD
jgi:hypothetical protein